MQSILVWLDSRTGIRSLLHEALFENIPGGSRWRYVWGSTLVFAFFVQMVTGVFLWMYYSPSTQTAWESVYYLEFEVAGGSLLRGIHHYMAQLMIVLLGLHLMQVIVDGAYRAPREVNFWLGMILMLLVMALGLTGYLLPWDQKGYWATRVATNIVGITPVIGTQLQQLVVGGSEYGHHTLTRFFALHAGVLPGLMIVIIALHVALFRRHGITVRRPVTTADAYFWPDQVLKDAVACLAVLVISVVLATTMRAELGAPANPAEPYNAARPEWYFLFLFQFLKFFHGETGEQIGAIYLPSAVFLLMCLMPFLGRWRLGHRFNIGFFMSLLLGIVWLTGAALVEDRRALWMDENEFASPEQYLLDGLAADEIRAKIQADLETQGDQSPYANLSTTAQLEVYFQLNPQPAQASFDERWNRWQDFEKSREFLRDVELAHAEAERAHELANHGIPAAGALSQLRTDFQTMGHKLFRQHCQSCHSHLDREDDGASSDPTRVIHSPDPSAANLYGFGTARWVRKMLDPEHIAGPDMFGLTAFADGEMVNWVLDTLGDSDTEEDSDQPSELATQLDDVAFAIAFEGQWRHMEGTEESDDRIQRGRDLIIEEFMCVDCHKFREEGMLDSAPDLTGYGSPDWLREFISNPEHERFYPNSNDRMPAFAPDRADPSQNRLTAQQLEMLVRWLRNE